MQRLITNEVAKTIPALYAQEGADDPIVWVHLFSCFNGWDWYITGYDPATGEAFGLVCGFEKDWGYISIPELEGVNRAKRLNVIERDEGFAPVPVSGLKGVRL